MAAAQALQQPCAPHTVPRLGHGLSATVCGPCHAQRRSPRSGPFPPDPPPAVARPCSDPSLVLRPGPTPRRRTRGAYGLRLPPPACHFAAGVAEVSRFSRQEFPDVHAFSDRAGFARRSRLARRLMWPSLSVHKVGTRKEVFRGSIGGPPVPLSTLHPRSRHRRRMTRGQRSSLNDYRLKAGRFLSD